MLAARPTDPFREFAYYVSGDFEGALKSNPNSIVSDAIHYAMGHTIVEAVLNDAFGAVKERGKTKAKPTAEEKRDNQEAEDGMEVSGMVNYLMTNADLYDAKPLASFVPKFGERAALAKPHFEAVLQHPATHHADDAAYFMGWLAFHQSKPTEALSYLSQAIAIGNGDFQYGALRPLCVSSRSGRRANNSPSSMPIRIFPSRRCFGTPWHGLRTASSTFR